MGWTGTFWGRGRPTKLDLDLHFAKFWVEEYSVVDTAYVKGEYYVLLQDKNGVVGCELVLIDYDSKKQELFYKAFDAKYAGYWHNCPVRLLKQITDAETLDWVAECYAKRKQTTQKQVLTVKRKTVQTYSLFA